VKFGITQHEIRAGLADLSTIGEQANVMRFGVATALCEAMGEGLKADPMAGTAFINALRHACGVLLHLVRFPADAARDARVPGGVCPVRPRHPNRRCRGATR